MESLTIGEVAKQAQVHIETLRYYERQGLVQKQPRTASSYRQYPKDVVQRVRFIKRAQELGFTLQEIKELLHLRAIPRGSSADARKQAERKIAEIDQKVRALQSMRKVLYNLITQCSGRGPATNCPILDTLDSEDDS